MISQVMPSPWNDKLALIKEYDQLYRGKAGRQPGLSSLEGFIAAKAFVKGLEEAGAHLTRASFKKAREFMHDIDLGGYALSSALSTMSIALRRTHRTAPRRRIFVLKGGAKTTSGSGCDTGKRPPKRKQMTNHCKYICCVEINAGIIGSAPLFHFHT
jgi:hypothetical protein